MTWEVERGYRHQEHALPNKAMRVALGLREGDRVRCGRCGQMVKTIHLFGETVVGPGVLESYEGEAPSDLALRPV